MSEESYEYVYIMYASLCACCYVARGVCGTVMFLSSCFFRKTAVLLFYSSAPSSLVGKRR